MDLKQIAKDTAKTVISYLTYQAVRTVIAQLSETDPPTALWLQQFSTRERVQDGEFYMQSLLQERAALGFRILTVREYLANEICEFLPEMVQTGIQESNLNLRCQQLERMTQVMPDSADPDSSEISHSDATDTAEPNRGDRPSDASAPETENES
jgi:hypothetical protein